MVHPAVPVVASIHGAARHRQSAHCPYAAAIRAGAARGRNGLCRAVCFGAYLRVLCRLGPRFLRNLFAGGRARDQDQWAGLMARACRATPNDLGVGGCRTGRGRGGDLGAPPILRAA